MMTARQWTKWLFTALCAIPWLIIFGAYFEICVARLALSRWPRALTDDPNIAAIEPLHFLVMLLFLSLVIAIPLVVVLAAWNWRKLLSDWRYSTHIAAFATGLLVLWILINRDPGNVWYWYLD